MTEVKPKQIPPQLMQLTWEMMKKYSALLQLTQLTRELMPDPIERFQLCDLGKIIKKQFAKILIDALVAIFGICGVAFPP